ncbi:alpha/beta hydrolase [Piscinibacter terrae]|nr:alpha/beta hydrolase [Albitalea terrae]
MPACRLAATLVAAFALLLLASCSPSANGSGVTMRTLAYGPLPQQQADVYEPASPPASAASRPVALLIHGGGWVAGSRSEFGDMARWLAQQGMVPIAIDYRFVTQATWPAQADDVERAVWWLRENAQALHADPSRVVAIGGSAGGHLAAWLGTTDHPSPKGTPSRVNAVVSMWGPWDLTATNVREDGKNMIAALMGSRPAQEASPLYRIDARTAPTMLIHGTRDELVPPDQSTHACEVLRAAKVECDLLLLEGEGHGLTSKNPDLRPVIERLSAFLGRHR